MWNYCRVGKNGVGDPEDTQYSSIRIAYAIIYNGSVINCLMPLFRVKYTVSTQCPTVIYYSVHIR